MCREIFNVLHRDGSMEISTVLQKVFLASMKGGVNTALDLSREGGEGNFVNVFFL